MAKAFTHYWAKDTVEVVAEGEPLDHTSGERFDEKSIGHGATIFAVNVRKGELYLIGRLVVGEFVYSDEEARTRLGYPPYSARLHLIAASGTSTPMSKNRLVPMEIVRQLTFHTAQGQQGLAFLPDGKLDRQTLRGVRRLTPRSADLLDEFLEKE